MKDGSLFMKNGAARKFIVLKCEDIAKLDGIYKGGITRAANKLREIRVNEGRSPDPEYLVINTDEPYADEVIEIMKRNGHWG